MSHPSSNENPPSLEEFLSWEPAQVQPLTAQKTVVFSLGGSSRGYFPEHGNLTESNADSARVNNNVAMTCQRMLDITLMMFEDGVPNVIVIGLTPRIVGRNLEFNKHLSRLLEMLIGDAARNYYDQHQIAPIFRGGWEQILKQIEAPELFQQFIHYERQTAPSRARWLIWATEDDPIPASLLPLVAETYQQTGGAPDRITLARAYYGRPIQHIDIFIGSSKPSVEGQLPPLVTVGDLYFCISPDLDMNRREWRSILYDHRFARRGHSRDYTQIQPAAFEELRAFYQKHREITLGVGIRHDATQTWHPDLPSTLW